MVRHSDSGLVTSNPLLEVVIGSDPQLIYLDSNAVPTITALACKKYRLSIYLLFSIFGLTGQSTPVRDSLH